MPVVYDKAISSTGGCTDMTKYDNGYPRLLCIDGSEAKCEGGTGPEFCEDGTAKDDIKFMGKADLKLGVCND